MRPKTISALLGAAVCAWVLGSCSSAFDYGPDRIARARIVAVTMPESLVAGHLALVTVHWYPTSCAEIFLAFVALNDANGDLKLEVMTRRRAGAFVCPDYYDPYPVTNSYPVMVPPTGARKLIVAGDQRSIVLMLQQNLPPAGPRHVVVALRPFDDQPAPNVALAYLRDTYTYPQDTLATAVTDSEGGAISTIDCGSSADSPTILRVVDPTGAFPAVGFLKFEGSTSLCGRSFRTVLFFGPTSSSASLANRESR